MLALVAAILLLPGGSTKPSAALARAGVLARAGHRRAALHAYEAVLDADPHQDTAERMVHTLRTDGEEELAFEQLQARAHRDPNNAALRSSLAEAFWDRRRYQDARREADAAVELDATQWHAYGILGRTSLARGEATEAQINLGIAAGHDPSDAIDAAALGGIALASGDRAAATKWFRRCVETVPQSPAYRAELAVALAGSGALAEAHRQEQAERRLRAAEHGRTWSLTGIGRPLPGEARATTVGACALDPIGDLVIVGSAMSKGGKTGYDFSTTKLDASGSVRWHRTADGWAHLDDRATAVATDRTGNVYVAGTSNSPLTDADIMVVKYDAAGREQWTCRWNGKANGYDAPTAIAVAADGEAYVTGFTLTGETGYAAVLLKLTSDGHVAWAQTNVPSGTVGAFGEGIAFTPSGAVQVVADSRRRKDATEIDHLEYRPDGSQSFATVSPSDAWPGSRPTLLVTRAGQSILAGVMPDGKGVLRTAVLGLDRHGLAKWRYFASGGVAPVVAELANGRILVVDTIRRGSVVDLRIVTLSPSGQVLRRQWRRSVVVDGPLLLQADSGGAALAFASFVGDQPDSVQLVSLSANGRVGLIRTYRNPRGDVVVPKALAVRGSKGFVAVSEWRGDRAAFVPVVLTCPLGRPGLVATALP